MKPKYVVWDCGENVVMVACQDGWRDAAKTPQGKQCLLFKNAGHLAAFLNAHDRKGRSVRAVSVGHGWAKEPAADTREAADEPEEYYERRALASRPAFGFGRR